MCLLKSSNESQRQGGQALTEFVLLCTFSLLPLLYGIRWAQHAWQDARCRERTFFAAHARRDERLSLKFAISCHGRKYHFWFHPI